MSQGRTRLSIHTGNRESELLSILERKDGDLIILIKRPEQMEIEHSAIYHDVRELIISVHMSPNSDGNTITSHFNTSNGKYSKTASFVRKRNGKLLWPIVGKLYQNLDLDRYKMKRARSDRVYSLGAYDPNLSILVMFVILTDCRTTMEGVGEFNFLKIDFEFFNLEVIWLYIRAPSFHQGTTTFIATSPIVGDMENIPKFEIRYQRSLSKPVLMDTIRSWLCQFSDDYVYKVRRWYSEQGEDLPEEVAEFSKIYLKKPYFSDGS